MIFKFAEGEVKIIRRIRIRIRIQIIRIHAEIVTQARERLKPVMFRAGLAWPGPGPSSHVATSISIYRIKISIRLGNGCGGRG